MLQRGFTEQARHKLEMAALGLALAVTAFERPLERRLPTR